MSTEIHPGLQTTLSPRGSAPDPPPKERRISPLLPVWISIRMALRGLGANRLRAFLTMLGVIIGVGAVIIAIAIGEGSKHAVTTAIQKLGTNVLTVRSGSLSRGGIGFGAGSTQTLVLADAAAILKSCPLVSRVSPEVMQSMQVKYQNQNTNVSLYGTGVDYPEIGNHRIEAGRFFTEDDISRRQRVAVLGSKTAKELFGQAQPLGRSIRVGAQSFDVIGVLKEKGGMGFQNPDQGVYIPYSTAMKRLFGLTSLGSIRVQASSYEMMKTAQSEIETLVRQRHKIASAADDDFMVMNQADIMDTQNAQQTTFSSLITYLAIVSLVVGGIGIMNIMLVSVTERTREIGVRKAIGARQRDILRQFLFEALFLSLVGGLLGVLFGVSGSRLVAAVNGWTVLVSAQTVALAFSFSAVIGVFFGYYPALKASRLNPIEALRHD